MAALSVENARIASNDKVTLGKLLKLGFSQSDTVYTLDAAALGAAGLSSNGLVALVRAPVPRRVAEDGTEVHPTRMVASTVTVRADGSADFTLAFDLET